MRILFLSDNFPPETNAPATRTFEHARVWVEHGHDVTIVTCAPNFPSGKVHAGYRNVPRRVEVMDGIRVVRVWTYVTANQGTVRRSLDYLSFLLAAVPAALVERRPDVVVGTSPQFFAAWAASVVSRLRRVPFVFELRDLWPESIAAVGAARGRFAIRVLERVADALYERADAIVSVTDSYVGILAERGVPVSKITVVRNGVDLDEFAARAGSESVRRELGIGPDEFVVTYVGTIGMAHGLSSTLEAARTTLGEPIRYLFVGEGAEKERLVREAARLGLSNVTFLAPQPRSRVPEILGASQAVLVHLRDAPLFATVIPSKIFEAMAMERPIILGVRGESAAIVERTRSGLVVSPEAPHELAAAIRRLAGDPGLAMRLGTNGRRAAETEFRRDTAAMKMLDVLLRSARPSDPTRPSSPDSRGAAPSGRPSTASRERRA
jgi:colanic acid biosynthesis glycosyl transferase WcaI